MKRSFRSLLVDLPRVPGVYLIEHLPTARLYIGCTTRSVEYGISTRIAHHFDNLVRNVHPNPTMQEAWNEDPNVDNWWVEALELTTDKGRERMWMNALGIPNEYDFNKVGCRK